MTQKGSRNSKKTRDSQKPTQPKKKRSSNVEPQLRHQGQIETAEVIERESDRIEEVRGRLQQEISTLQADKVRLEQENESLHRANTGLEAVVAKQKADAEDRELKSQAHHDRLMTILNRTIVKLGGTPLTAGKATEESAPPPPPPAVTGEGPPAAPVAEGGSSEEQGPPAGPPTNGELAGEVPAPPVGSGQDAA